MRVISIVIGDYNPFITGGAPPCTDYHTSSTFFFTTSGELTAGEIIPKSTCGTYPTSHPKSTLAMVVLQLVGQTIS